MSIVLDGLNKRFDGHAVVADVQLEIPDGELFVLLGPSGSGKTTILRMIAGLTDIDSGRVLLHGRDVTHLPSRKRGVGLVFQQYALFRHMTVAQNVEFALAIRRASRAERRRRRDELLEVVGLSGLGGRMPHQLSGGQQQRVALARALAHQPAVLLLDEPFGALDAKIRAELRRTVKLVQREFSISTIFVTHDQEEAFELGDRIGVMNFGRLLEVGPPEELYRRPATEFVATFLGTANLLVGRTGPDGIQVGPLRFPLATEASLAPAQRRVQVLFRPEDVQLAAARDDLYGPALGEAVVEQSIFGGGFERLRLKLPPLTGVRPIAPPTPFGDDAPLVEAVRPQEQSRRFPLHPGAKAWVGVRRVHALTHPGLNFLFLYDGSPVAEAAVNLGATIARMAHARVTLLDIRRRSGEDELPAQQLRERLGAGLAALEVRTSMAPLVSAIGREVERQGFDLLVAGWPRERRTEAAEAVLQVGEHHVLLVRRDTPAPRRVLICVAVGEPGKEDVQFTARLVRHLGAEGTLLSVLPAEQSQTEEQERAERFLAAGARSMALLGVRAAPLVLRGAVKEEITAEMSRGGYDMLVVGAPLNPREGKFRISGVLAEILDSVGEIPVLVVRSPYSAQAPAGPPVIRLVPRPI